MTTLGSPRSQEVEKLETWIDSLVTMKQGIGSVFRNVRQNSGLTQTQLGNKLNVSYVHLSRIESGLTHPSPALMSKLLNYLKEKES